MLLPVGLLQGIVGDVSGQCRRRRLHGAGRVEEIMARPAQIHRARTVHPTCVLRPRGRRTPQPTCALNPRGRRGRRHARQGASPTCALRPRGKRTLLPTALSPRGRRGRRHARQRASPGPTAPCASRGSGARSGPAAGVCWTTPTGYFLKGKGFLSDGQNPGNFFFSGDFW